MTPGILRNRIKQSDARQFLLFLFAGGTATLVQYGALAFQFEVLGGNPTVSAICAYLAGALTSYLLNFSLTFRRSGTGFRKGLLKFLLVNMIGLGLNTLIFSTLLKAGLYYLLAQACATGLALIWNYLGARLFVFRSAARA